MKRKRVVGRVLCAIMAASMALSGGGMAAFADTASEQVEIMEEETGEELASPPTITKACYYDSGSAWAVSGVQFEELKDYWQAYVLKITKVVINGVSYTQFQCNRSAAAGFAVPVDSMEDGNNVIVISADGYEDTTIIVNRANGEYSFVSQQEGAYEEVVARPTISPESQKFDSTQEVTIETKTEGAEIYYTTDGSTPTVDSKKYTGSFTVSDITTVKAIAVVGEDISFVQTATYTLRPLSEREGNYTATAILSDGIFATADDSVLSDLVKDTADVTVVDNGDGTYNYEVILTVGKGTVSDGSFTNWSEYGENGQWCGQDISEWKYRYKSDVYVEKTAEIVYDNKLAGIRKFKFVFEGSLPDGLMMEIVTGFSDIFEHPTPRIAIDADTLVVKSDDPDASELEATIQGAEEIDTTKYTQSTVDAFTKALKEAKTTDRNYEATQEEIDEATENLVSAYEDLNELDAPEFTYGVGKFSGSKEVEITCRDEEADIYYTTDGSIPTKESNLYTGAFEITETSTVKAIAISGDSSSEVSQVTYTKRTSVQELGTYLMKVSVNSGADTTGDDSKAASILRDTAKVVVREDEVGNTYYDVTYYVVSGTIALTMEELNEAAANGFSVSKVTYDNGVDEEMKTAEISYENELAKVRGFTVTYPYELPTEQGLVVSMNTTVNGEAYNLDGYALFDTSSMAVAFAVTPADTTELEETISAAQTYYDNNRWGDLWFLDYYHMAYKESQDTTYSQDLANAISAADEVLEKESLSQEEADEAAAELLDAYRKTVALIFDYDVYRITHAYNGNACDINTYYMNKAAAEYASLTDGEKTYITGYYLLLVQQATYNLSEATADAEAKEETLSQAQSALEKAQTAYDALEEDATEEAIATAKESVDDATKAVETATTEKEIADAVVAQRTAELNEANAKQALYEAKTTKKAAEAAQEEAEAAKETAEELAKAAQKKAEAAELAQKEAQEQAEMAREAQEEAEKVAKEAEEKAEAAQEELKEAEEKLKEAQEALKELQESQNTKEDQTTTTTPNVGTDTKTKKETSKVVKGVTYKISGSSAVVTKVSSSQSSVTIADTVTIGGKTYKVTKISDKVFVGNKKIKSITIGKNISSIGKQTFKGASKLKSVTIKGNSLTSIGKKAFKGVNKKVIFKVPSKSLKKYKKMIKKAGAPAKASYKNL
ncbi:chitobiase/beta-hexosaminidase C-terminal domain-containing protein [Eubacterium oxidoreducens]|uniref:Uncharacterized protein n=1 Tax=Eubacterium oxidoreducens TaxID=1732 RepID=A0A1G6A2X3_EUBOX|nr:chitobiase/beta-hexosaminidase C-terminal domain-containing protein [Eubacterium oxidoreducens]SDB02801.1 Protein of unknown function [Eubacterium oxidoreducens]